MLFVRLEGNPVLQSTFSSHDNTSLLSLSALFYLPQPARLHPSPQYLSNGFPPSPRRLIDFTCIKGPVVILPQPFHSYFRAFPHPCPHPFACCHCINSVVRLLPYNLTPCFHFTQAASALAYI